MLGQGEPRGAAIERCRHRVDRDVPRIGLLEIVRRAALHISDAGARASDARARHPGGRDPRLGRIEKDPPIRSDDGGATVAHVAQRDIAERAAVDRGEETKPLAAFVELLLGAIDAVHRQRLHLLIPTPAAAVDQRRLLSRCHRRQPADVPAAGHLPRELQRAEDVRAARPIDETAVRRRGKCQGSADTPAIEEIRARPVESPEVALATEPEIENRRAFDEERSLLIEESLDVAQVHDGRVNLHLTEVRVHGGVQREIGPQAESRIRAESR